MAVRRCAPRQVEAHCANSVQNASACSYARSSAGSNREAALDVSLLDARGLACDIILNDFEAVVATNSLAAQWTLATARSASRDTVPPGGQ